MNCTLYRAHKTSLIRILLSLDLSTFFFLKKKKYTRRNNVEWTLFSFFDIFLKKKNKTIDIDIIGVCQDSWIEAAEFT